MMQVPNISVYSKKKNNLQTFEGISKNESIDVFNCVM